MNLYESAIKNANNHSTLIRRINVGGSKKISTNELSTLFADLGCTNVRTYIESGNVIISAPEQVAYSVSSRDPRCWHRSTPNAHPAMSSPYKDGRSTCTCPQTEYEERNARTTTAIVD